MTFFFLIFLSHPALQTQAYTGNVLCPPPPFLLFGFIYLFIYYYEDIFLRDFLKAAGTTEEKWKILTSGLWDFVIQAK